MDKNAVRILAFSVYDYMLNKYEGCGDTLSNATQRVSDDDCRAVCTSNHTEYCGNANRIAIYDNTATGTGPTQCSSDTIANFTLSAVYNIPPEEGPSAVPLKVVLVEMVPSVTWAILSVRNFQNPLICI